jgi:EAL domain-containing protein (putative c-di-GMP-specific phosphodiesterase class I)
MNAAVQAHPGVKEGSLAMDGRGREASLLEELGLFENDAFGVALVRDGRVLRCNAKLERLHACGHGALVGRRLAIFSSAREAAHEARLHGDDGSSSLVRVSGRPLYGSAGDRQILWIVEDLTEREQARAAARRSRRRAAELALRLHRTVVQLHDELSQWHVAQRRDLQFEDGLRQALRDNSFELHYQPVIDLCSMELVGLEALVRWRGPDGRLVPPSDFIPRAEGSGCIVALGEWIFGEACRQAAAWRAAGLPLPQIAVNLSARQLEHPQLTDMVLGTLGRHGIAPGQIELEITETTLMQHLEATLPKLQQLADAGVYLAIDDFGTGYSSLSYLRQLPIRKLKIDRSFVRGLPRDRTEATIVAAVVAMAKNLGLTTTAEGVESPEQLNSLRTLGCDFGQGFHICKPVPAGAVPRLLARRDGAHTHSQRYVQTS